MIRSAADPTGDDDGIGTYSYPTDTVFVSVQGFDIYLDVDPGAGTGRSVLLDGRNASLEPGNGWDVAIAVEGWEWRGGGGPEGTDHTRIYDVIAPSAVDQAALLASNLVSLNLP